MRAAAAACLIAATTVATAKTHNNDTCGDASWRVVWHAPHHDGPSTPSKSCEWIGRDPTARCGLVGEDGRVAWKACPAECGGTCHRIKMESAHPPLEAALAEYRGGVDISAICLH
mmetsp:Transcript_18904/g.59032  ORF Transcript_18904/g.59032 Transcript_18904/m.59032 type:complete len:115 (+) Transcript_18904:199-543(+)